MATIGEALRAAREEQGLSLEDASAATHIRIEYLKALEQGETAALPDEIVARGFLRNYARYLGLESESLLPPSQEDVVEHPASPQDGEALDVPLYTSPIPIGAILPTAILVLLIAGLMVAVWFVYPRRTELFERFNRAAPIGIINETATVMTEETATATPVSEVSTPLIRQSETPALTATPKPAATPTSTPVPTVTQPPRTPTPDETMPAGTASAEEEIRLVLQVVAPAWTRVVVDGTEAYVGTLQTGDEREWVGKEQILLRTGNAGGVRLIVNDEDFGLLGEAGEVLNRMLLRDPANGQIVIVEPTPTPETSEPAPTTTG